MTSDKPIRVAIVGDRTAARIAATAAAALAHITITPASRAPVRQHARQPICQLCGQKVGAGFTHFCPACYWKRLNGKDRSELMAMHRRGHPIDAKAQSVVREVLERENRQKLEAQRAAANRIAEDLRKLPTQSVQTPDAP